MTVTLAQAQAHLRVDVDGTGSSAEDTLITRLIATAKAWVERYTAQPITATAVTQSFDRFGDYLELNRGPATAITTIAYTDTKGNAATVTGARLSDGRIYPPLSGWPSISQYSTITATYQAGFATTPPELDHAQLLLIGHWFENREAAAERPPQEMALAVEALCLPFRLPTLR